MSEPCHEPRTQGLPSDIQTLILAVQQLSLVSRIEEVADIVKRAARYMMSADGASFVLREGEHCYYLDEDAVAPLWKGKRFPMEACISGWVMLQRQSAIVPDIYQDPRIPLDAYEPTFVKSLVMVPVRVLDPVAAIGIYWSKPYACTEYEVQILQALADSTAIAMEKVFLLAELEARVHNRIIQLDQLETAKAELSVANTKLDATLNQMQTVEDVVRKCAWTNQFELEGEWVSVERYLYKRFGLRVSHGISNAALAHLQSKAPPGQKDVSQQK